MARNLPSLNALRAFEAAARNGSFLLAARELGLTPGAVSYQIKALESQLGVGLFQRLPRGVVLSEPGRAYQLRVADAFDRLGAATDGLVGRQRSRVVRITALPALAEKWLMPRLPRFRDRHPDIELQLSADPAIVDFVTGAFDVGLRYSDGRHPALHVTPIMTEEIFPVCSPKFLNGSRPLRHPEDLASHPLIYDREWREDWSLWLAAMGLRGIETIQGPTFTLYSMALEAAINGLGVVIGHGRLIAEDLVAGRLVAPFGLRIPAPRSHYLVCPAWSAERPAVAAFRAWLLAEAGTRSGGETTASETTKPT
jgi:LysR family transcriptional regulator, glycine cleavage system transcriptional activator